MCLCKLPYRHLYMSLNMYNYNLQRTRLHMCTLHLTL